MIAPAIRRRHHPHVLALWVTVAILSSCVLLAAGIPQLQGQRRTNVTIQLPPATAVPDLPNLLRPVSPQDALRDNAQRAFSARSDSSPAPFRFGGDPASEARALNCLTQAVYYEAAGEGMDGERAVAQVVLNRVRHPGFPASVCGVVYEGSAASSGCQFTFTCDGSLARTPAPSLWRQAQQIANQALHGLVFAPVGHATHYHADYVLPYWADSLDKSVQIGHHIFYRLKGALGDGSTFSQIYSRAEPTAISLSAAENAVETASDSIAPIAGPDENSAFAQMLNPGPHKNPNLLADSTQSVLLADNGATPAGPTAARPKPTGDTCLPTHSMKLNPLLPKDARSSQSADCAH